MSLFSEFHVPPGGLALHETLHQLPDVTVEIERVVAAESMLTPYFWVSGGDDAAFERAAGDDPSVRDLRQLDAFQDATLYRGEWTDNVQTLIYAYTHIGATILEATGTSQGWQLRMRFEDRDQLAEFRDHCRDRDVTFDLQRLYEIEHSRSGAKFGLTPTQDEALTTAWEMGYFDSPRTASMRDVAAELDISQQALSDLLRRAMDQLVSNALEVTPPADDPE